MNDLRDVASAFGRIFEFHQPRRPDETLGSLTVEEAYRVQKMVIEERISKGERLAGYKVGCTSAAIRRQFGLAEPIQGCVMAPWLHHGNADLNWTDYHQPAVEPEFVLAIGKELRDEVGENEPMEHAIEFVSPGIEVHHYHFWFGEPTAQELIASNGIHAALAIGDQKTNPRDFDWNAENVTLLKNGRVAASGVGAEIMGGPMNSLRWLVNHLVRRGDSLKPGDVVIPGSPVELVSVDRGDVVTARFNHLGQTEAVFG
ncbi:MAG: fumarylacetoacetate hydrolase family protein [Planctomycetales bacterium]